MIIGATLASTKMLCRPTRSYVGLARGSTLTYGLTCNSEQWWDKSRCSRMASPRRRTPYGGSNHVPVSLGLKEVIEIVGEHQRLTTHLHVVVAWLEMP